jgi:hypothetical protein
MPVWLSGKEIVQTLLNECWIVERVRGLGRG